MCSGVIFGDSWISEKRIKTKLLEYGSLEPPNYNLCISPHSSDSKNHVKIKLYSRGGTTWNSILKEEQRLKNWALEKPKWTLINTGACDIVNRKLVLGNQKDKNVGVEFTEIVIENLIHMLNFAKNLMGTDEYKEWHKEHLFLIAQLPDWCNFIQTRQDSMNSEEYKIIRREINHKLKLNKFRIYRETRAILFCPPSERPIMKGVHLDRKSQEKYNDNIIRVVGKIICHKCRLSEEPNKKIIKDILQPSKCELGL